MGKKHAYANIYFPSSLDFAQGHNVANEIQFDSTNKSGKI